MFEKFQDSRKRGKTEQLLFTINFNKNFVYEKQHLILHHE